jgi:thiosulfate/3-mercaptopyruvate sulfurtransferase
MSFTTLVSTADLAAHLDDPNWAIVDCRFDLADTEWGRQAYRQAHIPGAVYAHLDLDLSGFKTGQNGRHPLPDDMQFLMRLSLWGIGNHTQVVAYDQSNGMWASRLWWLLGYIGHQAAAVLDGGFAKWTREGRPARAGDERRTPIGRTGPTTVTITGGASPGADERELKALTALASKRRLTASAEEVERLRTDPGFRLIDSRAPERYRGEVEPLDPVAGHIPGAVNHYNLSNVNADGTFRAPEELRAKFRAMLGEVPPSRAVLYCGSGVAAAHNLLAMEVAGLSGAKVYAGSWSEWCSGPARPVAKGE